MKGVITVAISLLFLTICKADDFVFLNNNDYIEIQKINMGDLNVKMSYIIKKLQVNKKYSFISNRKFFEYIIIGEWHNPPHTVYSFSNNQSYTRKNFNTNEITRGNWRFSLKGLEINSNGKWEEKIILYCVLRDRDGKGFHSFTIISNDSSFFLNIDTDIVKVWKKNPPFAQ